MIELAPHMQPVAAALLGEPNRHLSNGKELRYGTHGSLSVDLEAGTWFDHERNVGGGVLDLVQRQLRSGRPGALAWLREHGFVDDTPARGAAEEAARRVVARYVYEDAQGRPRHRTVRWEPKGFSQERYEDGRWIGGKGALKGVERVLYREAELAGADEVIVIEGEKDADRLRALGFVATTNPQGAGKWRPRVRRGAGRQARGRPARQRRGRPQARRQGGRQPAGQGREREGARAAGPAGEGRRLATGSTPATPPTSCAG